MTAKDIRNLSVDELTGKEKELKLELFNLKLQNQLGTLKETARIKTLRKDIARIKTILTEMK